MTWLRDDAKEIRQMIVHESNVIAHRLQWLLTLQGFLLAGVTLSIEKTPQLSWLFPAVGIASAASALFVLFCAHRAIESLLRQWNDEGNKPPGYDGPPIIGRQPVCWLETLIYPWFLLPVLLIAVWFYVIFSL